MGRIVQNFHEKKNGNISLHRWLSVAIAPCIRVLKREPFHCFLAIHHPKIRATTSSRSSRLTGIICPATFSIEPSSDLTFDEETI